LESGVYLSMQRFGEVITYGECCSYPRVVLIFNKHCLSPQLACFLPRTMRKSAG
jgi:hypothetical protein